MTQTFSSTKVAATIVVTFALTVAAKADTLTLEQALDLAMENNRTIRSAAISSQKEQDKLAATRTRQFPNFSVYALGAQQLKSFDFTLEKGVLGEYGATGPLPSEDVHLKTPLAPTGLIMAKVTQPLTSLIRIRRNMDTQRTAIEIADEQTRSERQKIARDVRRVYYSLQQVESSLRTVRETTKLYQEVEKLTANYVLREVALKGDLLDARTRLAKTHQLEVELENQQSTAREQLNLLLGREVLTEFEVQPILEATGDEPALEESRARALRDRPEIRQALLRQTQAEKDLRAKLAERIPDIAAEFNDLSFLNWGRFMPTQTLSVGVSLTWEPFDWGRRKHEAVEKKRTIEQAKIAHHEARSSVLVDVNDKYRQLQFRRAELRVARMSQEAAVEQLRVTKNKFELQAVLLKDVLQTQVNLEQSNSDYHQALASFWNARADYERAMGEDQ